VVAPDNALDHAESGYTRAVEQQGWAHLASPLDAQGLGDPPEWGSARVAATVQRHLDAHVAAQRAHWKAVHKETPAAPAAADALAAAARAKEHVLRRARRAAYRRFYADYTRHRVLYQVSQAGKGRAQRACQIIKQTCRGARKRPRETVYYYYYYYYYYFIFLKFRLRCSCNELNTVDTALPLASPLAPNR
jgi:hypothetical protein